MTIYFRTKTNGRCGCSNMTWRKEDKYDKKVEVRKHYNNAFYGRIVEIYTEEQLKEKYPNNWENIMKEAY